MKLATMAIVFSVLTAMPTSTSCFSVDLGKTGLLGTVGLPVTVGPVTVGPVTLSLPVTVGLPVTGDLNNGLVIEDSIDKVTYGNPACKNCTPYVIGNLFYLQQIAQLYGNKPVATGIDICNECFITGLNTIRPLGDVCAYNVSGRSNLVDTILHLIFDNITVACVCTIPNNVNDLQKELTNLTIPKACNMGTDEVIQIADGVVQGTTAINQTLDPKNIESCTKLGNLAIRTNVTLIFNIQNFTATIVAREDITKRGPNSTTVNRFKVTIEKYQNLNTTCDAVDQALCDCVIDTQLAKTLEDIITERNLYCFFKDPSNTQIRSTLNSYISCAKIPN